MLEALLALLRGERPGRIVWTADITYWMSGREQRGDACADWDAEEGYLQLHRDLGVLPYYYYPKFTACRTVFDGTVRFRTQTRGNRTEQRIETPVGSLTSESCYLAESCCSAQTDHPVTSPAELETLLYILEHRRLEPDNLDDYAARMAAWRRYDGLPSLGFPRSPLAALCCEWCGVADTAFLLADAEDTVRQVLAVMEEQEGPMLDALCELAPPLVHFPDNLSSDNLGGWYDTYMAGPHRRRIARLHAADVRCVVHLDGAVRGLLPKLAQSGFDSVEALTPRPVGDLTAAEMRSVAGSDDLILWGGVPGAMFAPPYTWEQMEAHVESLLAAWDGQPFVVGVADQVPPDGDITFCRRIADMLGAAG